MTSSRRLAVLAATARGQQTRRDANATTAGASAMPPERDLNSPFAVNLNFVMASATLCGVMLAVCAACWRRGSRPQPAPLRRANVFTLTAAPLDIAHYDQWYRNDTPGPPPAYDLVVRDKPPDETSQVIEPPQVPKHTECPTCTGQQARSWRSPSDLERGWTDELPSYEAALQLRDSKL